jgi:hypothetical protein
LGVTCRQHQVDYDDGDRQEHLLARDKFVLLDAPRAAEPEAQEGALEGEAGQDEEQHLGQHGTPPAKRPRLDGANGDGMAPLSVRLASGSLAPASPPEAADTPLQASPEDHRTASAAVARLPVELAACCLSASRQSEAGV